MTRTRPLGVIAFVAVAVVLVGALVSRQVPPSERDARPSGCVMNASTPSFCLDLAALASVPPHSAPSGTLGLLDQLPACGRPNGMFPSFCLEQPTVAAASASTAASAAAGGGPCAQTVAAQAPVFCLSAVTASSAPGMRDDVIRYLARIGGTTMRPVDATSADLQVDAVIGDADAGALSAAVDADVLGAESYIGRAFTNRPLVFVLGTPSTYAITLEHLLGYSAGTADMLAIQTGGLYVADPSVIFVNWASVRGAMALVVMRHELTHALVREIAGPEAAIPAWVDEGFATVVQSTAAPSNGLDRGSFIALALLQRHRTSLEALTPLADWSTRNAELGGFAYSIAAKAVRELLRETSLAQFIAILAAQHRGLAFADAYSEVTSRTYASFLQTFADNISACGPDVATGARASSGDVPYVVYGFGPQRAIHLTIESATYSVTFDVHADEYGTYVGVFGSTAGPGIYELSAADGSTTAHTLLDTRSGRSGPSSGSDVCSS